MRSAVALESAIRPRIVERWRPANGLGAAVQRPHGKVFREFVNFLAETYEAKGGNLLARPTIQKKVTAVRNVLDWAELHSAYGIKYGYENEWGKLRIGKVGQPSKMRMSWEVKDLNKLFALEIPEEMKLVLRMIACTSCRLEEIVALQWGDLQDHHGVWCINLRRETIPVKKPNGGDYRWVRRRIPIMKRLKPYIELHMKNFTEEEVAEGSTTPLFGMFPKDKDGKASSGASKKLLRMIDSVRPHSDEFKIDLHSFRHTFSNQASSEFMPDSIRRKVTGHKQFGRDAQYNWEDPINFKKVYKAMNKLKGYGFIRGGME